MFDDPTAVWTDEGEVIPPSGKGNFDSAGTFTPGVVVDCEDGGGCKWYLFYGGVANENSSHTENVGLATSDNPWGPFTRRESPVFNRTDANSKWCGTAAARVDEIKPSLISGQRVIFVKSVCTNFSALPIAFIPENGWGPPYKLRPPVISLNGTCENKGFEEPTIYTGPDNLLHFAGHYHGRNCGPDHVYAHYLNPSQTIDGWIQVADYGFSNNSNFREPLPVPLNYNGVFGERIAETWIESYGNGGYNPPLGLMMTKPVWVEGK
eukprot:TRINITY_DN2345_c1_g2_i1.p1 TRINITY_DN2345_c1_g2~~TRINITY_DN2345_c1_g2_i1.p1  ORF type:complete len:265 (+),score=49.26 TRINITY_DN2345_c1_g2_i1:131-925(+)